MKFNKTSHFNVLEKKSMNSALKAFIKSQVDSLPSIVRDFPAIYVDERLKELKISEYFDENNLKVNLGYFDTKDHLDDCVKEPFWFIAMGKYRGQPAPIWEAIKANPLVLAAIESESQTKAMVEYCLNKHPTLIAYANRDLIDRDFAQKIIEAEPMLFEFLPDSLKNYKNAMLAFEANNLVVSQLPLELIDSGVKSKLLNSEKFLLNHIPYDVWDTDLLANQINLDPPQGMKISIEQSVVRGDYVLFEMIVNSVNANDINAGVITHFVDKGLFHSENMIAMLNHYFNKRPESHILFDLKYLNSANIITLIDLNADIKLPVTHWDLVYKHIYNNSSPIAFQMTNEQAYLITNHQSKWVSVWVALNKGREEKNYLHPVFLNTDIIHDEDIWSNIYDSRLIYKLQKNYQLADIEALKTINTENTHPIEITKIKNELTPELKLELFGHDAIWWFALNAEDLTEENTLIFMKKYPHLSSCVPSYLLTSDFKAKAINEEPQLQEYLK